jgi:curli biogenesis system outer membrane secretion channel CsgG
LKPRISCLFFVTAIATCYLTGLLAAQNPRIIVVNFTGSERFGEVANGFTEILSETLVNFGSFDVLERAKLHDIMQEQRLGRSGMVDSLKATELGKLMGAEYVVTGTITEANVRQLNFNGYGVETSKIEATLEVSVKIIKLDQGNIIFSKTEKATDIQFDANESHGSGEFPAAKLSRVLCSKLGPAIQNSQEFVREKANSAKLVTVEFKSNAENATIEIDGIVRGNTGSTYKFPEGIHEVKISAQGYKEWSKRVSFYEGFCIEVNLTQDY